MIQRKDHIVAVIGKFPPTGSTVSITAVGMFELHHKGELVARCLSAKRLADWSFEQGAQVVVYNYNLSLSDGEL